MSKSKISEMSYDRLYPVTRVNPDRSEAEIKYTLEEWREYQKKCDESFRELKREFMDSTHVYVSDSYFYDYLYDDTVNNHDNAKTTWTKWHIDQFERNLLEKLTGSEIKVTLEDAIRYMELLPEQALTDDALRGNLNVLDIIQQITKERDELSRKYFAVSEHVADIYNSSHDKLTRPMAEALKHAHEGALINCGVYVKEIEWTKEDK